jgi:hypothetical protein
MFEKEHDEKGEGMENHCDCGMGLWAKEFGKEFKIAYMKKKERILEAKLEFIREINRLIEKSSSKPKEKE